MLLAAPAPPRAAVPSLLVELPAPRTVRRAPLVSQLLDSPSLCTRCASTRAPPRAGLERLRAHPLAGLCSCCGRCAHGRRATPRGKQQSHTASSTIAQLTLRARLPASPVKLSIESALPPFFVFFTPLVRRRLAGGQSVLLPSREQLDCAKVRTASRVRRQVAAAGKNKQLIQ